MPNQMKLEVNSPPAAPAFKLDAHSPDLRSMTLQRREASKVLLVDDDEIVLELTSVMLSMLGFTVLRAIDGIEAVAIFRQHREDIRFVLSDVVMPRMNGWETLTALRQITPGIAVILVSGCSVDQVMKGAHSELPQAFLRKPFGFKSLRDAIRLLC
jgi:two-component system, cell cycle sensor histidine kinase and response regulator CckA